MTLLFDAPRPTAGPVPAATPPADDTLAAAILDLLAAGHCQPGQRLPSQRQLALRLCVSRPTVREALAVLETLGRVRTRPGRGAFLAAAPTPAPAPDAAGQAARTQPPSARLTQIYQFRYVIEPALAGLVAKNATGAQIEDLRGLTKAMRAALDAGDLPLVARCNVGFHTQLVEAANNPFFTKAIAPALDGFFEGVTRAPADPAFLAASVAEHEALAKGLAERSPAEAREAMRRHILGAAARAGLAFALEE